jgi:hypothetical protein
MEKTIIEREQRKKYRRRGRVVKVSERRKGGEGK